MSMASHLRRRGRKPNAGGPVDTIVDGHAAPQLSTIEIACWSVLFAGVIAGLIWKHCSVFFLSWTDEQIHFYVARRIAEGAVLYRDIESARPPLALLPLALLISAGGSPLLAGRAIVFVSQLATGWLLLWGGWRLVSFRVGALAALLFLSSPEAFSRIHYTSIHLAALTAAACVLFSLRSQPWRAGLSCGLALAADQHGLAICAIVALMTLARRPRDALRLTLGAFLVSGIVFGGVWAMGSRHLWKSLVEIHLFHLQLGQGGSAQFWELFTPWLYEHGYLIAGAVLGTGLLAFQRKEARPADDAKTTSSRVVRVLLLVVGGHIAVVLAMADAAFLYIVVITPMLALLAAIGFDATVARWTWLGQVSKKRTRPVSRMLVAVASAVLALAAGGWSAARSHRESLDGRRYSFLPHVLHGQVSLYHRLDVAQRVADDLPKHGTIFGDPTIVSAVALDSDMRVSGELADLNPIWIQAGMISRDEVVSRIERDGVSAVITPPWFLVQDRYFSSYLAACYEQPKIFAPPEGGPGEGLPDILVFPHIRSNAPCRVSAQ
jgi:hypothetical protein